MALLAAREELVLDSTCSTIVLPAIDGEPVCWPALKSNILFVRPEYKELYTLFAQSKEYAILSGTPGIGKSSFGFYLLWRLATEGKTVAYIYRKAAFDYVVFSNGTIGDRNDIKEMDPDSYIICDGEEPFIEVRRNGFPECPNVYLITSPKSAIVKEFIKFVAVMRRFYLPLPADRQVRLMRDVCFSSQAADLTDDVIASRIAIWGPVPRYVLLLGDGIAEAEALLGHQDEAASMKIVFTRKPTFDFIMQNMTTGIYTPFVDPKTFLLKEVGFISNYFLRAVLMKGSVATEIGAYLASMLRNPAMLSTHYHFFELWAIYQLRQGKAFPIRELGSQTEASEKLRDLAKGLLPLKDGDIYFPKAEVTPVVNAADNETVLHYQRGQRLIMHAGFPAIDTVENTWLFANASTNVAEGLLVQGEKTDSGLLPLVNLMTAALNVKPPRAVAFLWLTNRATFPRFPL
jgi:hypothetical protein